MWGGWQGHLRSVPLVQVVALRAQDLVDMVHFPAQKRGIAGVELTCTE